ncbi:hypothetical protein [uncultured Pseudodesulfovibrio sp.]|uniref:hypothetical protein n=1 Tax=uncultured Pseudodesulfovibrio sp. TaxID=2035858 RepID=UPI0029C674D9|nr:hypothetical protein [uncultured Pseudodesulfovibrio sp.]
MKLKKLEKAFEEIEAKHRPIECVWQVVRRDSDFLSDIEAFSPVTRTRSPAQLPDDEEERIRLLNRGAVLLLDGVLRLFVIPDDYDQKLVEKLFDKLTRIHGNNRAQMYKEAHNILFRERN